LFQYLLSKLNSKSVIYENKKSRDISLLKLVGSKNGNADLISKNKGLVGFELR
jgi:hypothetical protein